MKFIVLMTVLLLSLIAQAQADDDKCLIDNSYDNRISGTVMYDEYPYSGRPGVTIRGYKLVLLSPRCYERTSGETGKKIRGEIKEIAIEDWKDNRAFLKTHVGQLITIKGQILSNSSPYNVAPTQIFPDSLAACEVAPKSQATQRC